MTEINHRMVYCNGQRLHIAEQGEGPLVLMIHGFPECWYSWHAQLPAVAGAGYHAVAPDMRGYGRSSKPTKVEDYRITELINDLVGLVEALGEKEAVIVGHDWGSLVAWTAAWTRPDVFRAVVGGSIPFSGRGLIALSGINPMGELKPSDADLAAAGPDHVFYLSLWLDEETGFAAQAEPDVSSFLRDHLYAFSADAFPPGSAHDIFNVSVEEVKSAIIDGGAVVEKGTTYADALPKAPTPVPEWLETQLPFFVEEFERTGFEPALNWYRCLDQNWEDLAPFEGKPVTQPAMFIGGDHCAGTLWGAEAVWRFPETVPNLIETYIIPNCGHWLQLEQPDEVNAALVRFLRTIDA